MSNGASAQRRPSSEALSSMCANTFRRAQKTAGTRQRLAEFLGVTVQELDCWIQGTKLPPAYIFLRALDLAYRDTSPVSAPVSDLANDGRPGLE